MIREWVHMLCFENKMIRKAAFTLVEVLIVIIIIGVLAGGLYLAVGGSDEKAKEAACLGNREAIKTGWSLYKFADANAVSLDTFIKTGYHGYITNDKAKCPSGGEYSDSNNDNVVECSVHKYASAGGGGGGSGGGEGEVDPGGSGSLTLTDSTGTDHTLKVAGTWKDVLAEAAASNQGGIKLRPGDIYKAKDGKFYVVGWNDWMSKDGNLNGKIEVSLNAKIFTAADTVNNNGTVWKTEIPSGSFCQWNGKYYIAPSNINVNTFPTGGWIEVWQ